MPYLNYMHQEEWSFVAGDMQSPINIEPSQTHQITYDAPLKLQYDKTVPYVHDTGRGIEFGLTGPQIWLNHRPFAPQQGHLHFPSEHTLRGRQFDGELHFVHQAPDGRLGVVAILLQITPQGDTSLKDILAHMPTDEPFQTDIMALLPESRNYYQYLGSLTTPPLTENVEWYILDEPLAVSSEQLERFKDFYIGNNRDIQPLHTRVVQYYEQDESEN